MLFVGTLLAVVISKMDKQEQLVQPVLNFNFKNNITIDAEVEDHILFSVNPTHPRTKDFMIDWTVDGASMATDTE